MILFCSHGAVFGRVWDNCLINCPFAVGVLWEFASEHNKSTYIILYIFLLVNVIGVKMLFFGMCLRQKNCCKAGRETRPLRQHTGSVSACEQVLIKVAKLGGGFHGEAFYLHDYSFFAFYGADKHSSAVVAEGYSVT